MDGTSSPLRLTSRVIGLRALSPTGFELTLDRCGISFRAGQLLVIHGRHLHEERSYTICSGEKDEHLQILFRLIPEGRLTPWLAGLKPGDPVDLSAPYGEFIIRDLRRPAYFIATGTGIAPARAYIRTHPEWNLTLVHGVRDRVDLFYHDEFSASKRVACLSSAPLPGGHARVTGYMAAQALPCDAHYYLCGSNAMFYDMRDVLAAQGVPSAHIFTEAYYYEADT